MGDKAGQALKMKFKRASKMVWSLTERPSNEQLLELYALYKQATEGDCQGKARGGLKERAKWKSWNAIIGMSQVDAMGKYCSIVDELDR